MFLYIWPAEFGLPSMDIESLQFMPAKFVLPQFYLNIQLGLGSDLPYLITEEQETICDFSRFVDFLRNSKQDIVLDNDLVPSQLCDFDAYSALLKQKIRPALLQTFWLDKYNYNSIIHNCYTQHLIFPYGLYYMEKKRSKANAAVKSTRKSQQQITMDAVQALNMLSAKLSDNKYFCGDKPCSLDALIFGYLAPLLKTPLPNDRLQLHLSATPNLVRFVESILSIYMPLNDKILREQKISKPIWQKRKENARRLMEEGRVEKEMRKNEKEQSRPDSTLHRTLFFGIACLTTTILFALHTGIIVVEKVQIKEKKEVIGGGSEEKDK
uniref:Metaxin n=1 Tax=Meloidogyne incognita TaxID=6306 RepID=A0A914M4R0_MELIC